MKVLKWWGYLFLTLIIVIAGAIYVTLPMYDGVIKVKSKYGKVTIYRDNEGVPHLFAENEEAAYFGTGYMHAQDRMWVLEKFRRLAKGTMAEILGDEAYPIDYLMRQFGFEHVSKAAIKNLDPELLKDFSIVAEGVNEYIKDNILPMEYYILGIKCEPFGPLDLLSVEKFIDFAVSYNHQMELTRDIVYQATNSSEIADKYMPYKSKYFKHNQFPSIDDEELKKQGIFVQDGMEIASRDYTPSYSKYDITKSNILEDVKKTLGMVHFEGSNGWVIHGNYTKSGMPILSVDPHLSNMVPWLWHFAEITYEDKEKNQNITQVGSFAVGQPWIMMGRAQNIAFTITAFKLS